VDDILNATGDASRVGRPVESDLRRGAVTLPVLCYLEMGREGGALHAVRSGQRHEAHVRVALEAIRASGAVETAPAEAQAHVCRAEEALEALPDNDARRALHELAEYVIGRDR